ncbi:MAG: hypothetical protein HON43_04340 [Alphaproteobacteria bacterium]|jgi:hypothetical protein|nr:hypothetical protein [Alphaproteobacteria bacterium]MBT5390324.1 hypothetical protein [Alphaproteobacteria bacterium]
MKQNSLALNTLSQTQKSLKNDGYALLPSVFDRNFLEPYLMRLNQAFKKCADELDCQTDEYLTALSRWSSPSPITSVFDLLFVKKLSKQVERVIGDCSLEKVNVISKTKHSPEPVPFHQDISYSPDNPYQITAWVALTDVPPKSGPLDFVLGSHLDPIQPAVDFWSPQFVDLKRNNKSNSQSCISLPAKAGDTILFDSRTWHGSGKNEIGFNRFAFVTRWKSSSYQPPKNIPEIQKSPFGMWTCQSVTQGLLERGLETFLGEKMASFEKLLLTWQDLLMCHDFPFLFDKNKARLALQNLHILHQGHELHNGSDAHGTHYVALWNSLLRQLKLYLETRGEKDD